MIYTDRTITVLKGESKIDKPIVVYRGDYALEVRFTITNSRFKFTSGTNLIETEKASFGQLAILTPYGGNIFSDIVKCSDGTMTFVLTKSMIDQIEEIGLYSFQIRLYDYNKESRVSIPPIEFGIEVREPIASEDHDNSVNNAIVGYSIAKVVDPKEENVGNTFDESGNYNKTKWETGDRISEGKLNKIEDAIDKINRNEINDKNALDKRLTSNFNVLTSQLATKANDDVVVKKGCGTLSDFDEETRAVIQGLEPGKINAVLGDRNVKYTNTDFIEMKLDDSLFTPIDLYDKENISEVGYFANLTNGNIVNTQYTQNYVNTGFIECHNTVRYVITGVSNLCLYDKDRNFLSSISEVANLEIVTINGINGRLLNVPEGCEYIICNLDKNYIDHGHIWQLDRFQSTDDCTLTIPRLDLYKTSVFSVNGKEAIENNVNLTAMDVGAMEPIKNLISKSLPCVLGDELRRSRGVIYTTSDLGDDLLIAKSINEFNV